MKHLPDDVLLAILANPHISLRKLAARLHVSTHTIQRIRRVGLPQGVPLSDAQAALYKPSLRVESVKPAIDYDAVVDQRASGLTIKDCWGVYRRDHPDGYSLPAFSALAKKHAAVPDEYVPAAGPVMVPVSAHAMRLHWPEPVDENESYTQSKNPLDGVLTVDVDGSVVKRRHNELVVGNSGSYRRFMPAAHGLRAVVIECEALISTAALAWLEREGVTLFISSRGGPRLEACGGMPMRVFGYATPSAGLRRAQYAVDGLTLGRACLLRNSLPSGS